jgi:peptide/nickel transport system substrate-binding protein
MGRRVSGVGYRVSAIFFAALAVVGCAVPFLQSKTEGSGVLVVALDSPVLTLDPAHVTELSSARVTSQVYETLVEYNSETGAFDPLLAQSWAVSSDGRVWTFTLRSGIFFHDGAPLNADAVVQNILRWMDASNPYHLGDFDYWQLLFGGFEGSGSIVRSVESVGDLRLRLTLELPHSPLLAALSTFAFGIVSPKAMYTDVDRLRLQPVGTGPFKFVEWKDDGEISLAANQAYWGGKPKLAGVRFVVVEDDAARPNALRDGKAHVVEGGDAAAVDAARHVAGAKVLFRPSRSVVFLSMNQKSAPLDDVRVRQAIAQAINRQAIVEKAYGGAAQAADQFTPPSVAGYDRGLTPLVYDRNAAKQLLNEAGYGGWVTQMWYPATPRASLPDPQTIAASIADDLRAVGIVASPSGADWPTFQRRSLEGGFSLYVQGWTGDSPDADSYLSGLFAGEQAARSIGYTSPAINTTLAAARAQNPGVERTALYKQAASTLRSDMPRVPLVHPQSPVLLAGEVKGLALSALGVESYRNVSLGK